MQNLLFNFFLFTDVAHGDEARGHNWRWGAVQIWKRHSTLG